MSSRQIILIGDYDYNDQQVLKKVIHHLQQQLDINPLILQNWLNQEHFAESLKDKDRECYRQVMDRPNHVLEKLMEPSHAESFIDEYLFWEKEICGQVLDEFGNGYIKYCNKHKYLHLNSQDQSRKPSRSVSRPFESKNNFSDISIKKHSRSQEQLTEEKLHQLNNNTTKTNETTNNETTKTNETTNDQTTNETIEKNETIKTNETINDKTTKTNETIKTNETNKTTKTNDKTMINDETIKTNDETIKTNETTRTNEEKMLKMNEENVELDHYFVQKNATEILEEQIFKVKFHLYLQITRNLAQSLENDFYQYLKHRNYLEFYVSTENRDSLVDWLQEHPLSFRSKFPIYERDLVEIKKEKKLQASRTMKNLRTLKSLKEGRRKKKSTVVVEKQDQSEDEQLGNKVYVKVYLTSEDLNSKPDFELISP